MVEKTYLIFMPKTESSPETMRIHLGGRVTEELTKFMGNTCNVLVQPVTGEIAVMRGNNRRICQNVATRTRSAYIALGSARSEFFENHGRFTRMFFTPRWEEDEQGHKFLYLEPNGKFERDGS